MDELTGLKYMLMDELKELAKGGKLNAGDVDVIYKLVCATNGLDQMEMGESHNSYRRDSRGRYSRRDGGYSREDGYSGNRYSMDYSRAGGDMANRLRSLMGEAETEEERRAIKKAIEMMER